MLLPSAGNMHILCTKYRASACAFDPRHTVGRTPIHAQSLQCSSVLFPTKQTRYCGQSVHHEHSVTQRYSCATVMAWYGTAIDTAHSSPLRSSFQITRGPGETYIDYHGKLLFFSSITRKIGISHILFYPINVIAASYD